MDFRNLLITKVYNIKVLNKNMKILDLGCGRNKIKDSIGVDIINYKGVDIVMDLNKFPYNFRDKTFDLIYCYDTIEHLEDITSIMKELYRILKDNGNIKIRVPHFSSLWAFSDPTHKHFFGYKSFDCYCGLEANYLNLFNIKSRNITFGRLFKFLEIFFNKFPGLYERRLAFIFQANDLFIVLGKKL